MVIKYFLCNWHTIVCTIGSNSVFMLAISMTYVTLNQTWRLQSRPTFLLLPLVRFLCLDILVSVQCVPTLFLRGRHMVFVTNIERTVRRTILVIFARIGPWKGGQTWSHMSEIAWTNKRNRSPLLYPALSQRIALRRRRLLHSNKRLSAL